jgi:hypothetical protein
MKQTKKNLEALSNYGSTPVSDNQWKITRRRSACLDFSKTKHRKMLEIG